MSYYFKYEIFLKRCWQHLENHRKNSFLLFLLSIGKGIMCVTLSMPARLTKNSNECPSRHLKVVYEKHRNGI